MWKLKRELRRMAMQAGWLPWLVAGPIARRVYDRRKDRLLRVTGGETPVADELAVMLLYQPGGLLASTFHTLDHLGSHGVSTLVVSNAPLSGQDRDRLRAHAWRIIERPNFGYDFGGYRDGILHVLEQGLRPSRLHVLNDSIWFPLGADSDLVDQARASGADLYGFVLNDRVRGDHRRHIQSYFFSFGGGLVAHGDFEAFWRNLFLTNNKDLVVRRCEIPMTGAFQSRGHSVAFRHTYGDGARALKALDNDTLRRVIAYQVKVDTRNAGRLGRHLDNALADDAWRAGVMEDIEAGILDKYFLIAHPAVLIGQLGVPLLKKDRQEIYQHQRAALVDGGFDIDFAPVIRDEIRGWDG